VYTVPSKSLSCEHRDYLVQFMLASQLHSKASSAFRKGTSRLIAQICHNALLIKSSFASSGNRLHGNCKNAVFSDSKVGTQSSLWHHTLKQLPQHTLSFSSSSIASE
jgi:hypothetical protein